tara:strand:- start:348 stop:1427 length:1080 start_codon:yes stop_codon:yes gene_type:complete
MRKDTDKVVAERRLLSSDGEVVRVQVLTPCPGEDGWVCEYQLIGSAKSMKDKVVAEDGLAALRFAVGFLESGVSDYEGTLRFPKGIPGTTGLELYHRDADLNALVTQLEIVETSAQLSALAAADPSYPADPFSNLPPSETLIEIERIRQRIRIRISEAVQTCSESPLFSCNSVETAQCGSEPDSENSIWESILLRQDTGKPVRIGLWGPRLVREMPGPWKCEYEIHGLRGLVRNLAVGVDSLGALRSAFHAIWLDLKNSELSFNVQGGHGEEDGLDTSWSDGASGFEPFDSDPLHNALIEQLILCEVTRNKLFAEELRTTDPDATSFLHHLRQAEVLRCRLRCRFLQKWVSKIEDDLPR